MSSFTSNFRSEGRVLLTVAAVALACEAALRLGSERLSVDIAHIRTIPAVAAALRETGGVRVLFLGNSLTREGLELESVRAELSCGPSNPVTSRVVHPDDTTVLDWYYLFRRDFGGRGAPEYLVLSFVREQLSDSTSIHPDRIAAYFGGWANAAEMLRLDLSSMNEKMGYLLASTFRVFAERERVRDRFLSMAVPDYRGSATRLNEAVRQTAVRGSGRPGHTRLGRLLSLCQQRGVRAVVVAMPQVKPYGIDPGLQAVLSQHGAQLVDMRETAGLTDGDYGDGYHLSPKGARLYSAALGRRLRELICEPSAAKAFWRTRRTREPSLEPAYVGR